MKRQLGAVLTLILFSVNMATASPPPSIAKQILDATGVRGGLIVHLGCGDGRLTAALRANERFIVQGLDTDVAAARRHIRSLGLYGKVTAEPWTDKRLPYVDNLVNLVVADDLGKLPMSEVLRVLVPGGVAYVAGQKTVKPWPKTIDEWTHALHGPDNNAVAEDTVVGPPRHLQWISPPRFSRSHDHLASVSVVVSAGGRVFYIVDEGSIAFAAASPRWQLVARDAFNGVKLWEREISTWEYHLRDFRSGPADIDRRLVAVGARVYVTLGYGEPVSALDAATGETVRRYAGTEGTQEILCDHGVLLLVLGRRETGWQAEKAKQIVSQTDYSPPFERYTPPVHDKRVMAVAAETGKVIWSCAEPYARKLMPSTLAASAGRVYFENPDAVVCLDEATGKLQWRSPRAIQRQRLAWSTPTVVVHEGVVYSADRGVSDHEGDVLWLPSGGYHRYLEREDAKGELIALDAQTGRRLWNCPAYEGFNAPVDVLIADGLLWTGRFTWSKDPGIVEGRDPKTGEVLRRRPPDQQFMRGIGHARCHRVKATARYILMGRRGVEFVDLQTGDMLPHRWVRGICQYGVMPANGLLYVPPHSCACSVDELLKSGFMALAPKEEAESRKRKVDEPPRLEKGPAYAGDVHPSSLIPHPSPDWPTYRHDAARSGALPAAVSPKLRVAWETDLGGKLSAPVVAGGVLLVAQTDGHRVCALDAASGRRLWTREAGSRIDSPPTIDGGRALFGSADGRVYCLRLADGALIWTFRAAPQDRQVVVDGQLESDLPVPGSVLVLDGAAYFVAGRSRYLDNGMFLYKLDAATGRELRVLDLAAGPKQQESGGRRAASVGYLPDVLSARGDSIFMRGSRFNRDLVAQKENVAHLWSSVGFLDGSWWHRTYWQIGTSMGSGWGNWPKAGQRAPAGRLLVTDDARVFGFGRNQYDIPGAHVGVDAAGVWGPIGAGEGRWTYYRLFGRTLGARAAGQPNWTRSVPVLVQAMVLAQGTLFVAGPPDALDHVPHEPAEVDRLAEALESTRGGRLETLSAADGKSVARYDLKSPPVFDGMAAAQGRLFIPLKDGTVLCMEGDRAPIARQGDSRRQDAARSH